MWTRMWYWMAWYSMARWFRKIDLDITMPGDRGK